VSGDPFLERLKERAKRPGATEPEPASPPAAAPPARASEPAPAPDQADRRALAFWQSPVANAFIRERISGDGEVSPAGFFASLADESVRGGPALSLRAGDTKLECELLRLGACAKMTILGATPERREYFGARIPDELRARVDLEHAEAPDFTPPEPLTVVIANSSLHRSADPDALVARIGEWLAPGGMVYVDEFVGPDRFQWTDAQIEIVNQLLASLPQELRRDLANESNGVKSEIGRPDPQRFARDHPTEAVAGERIRAALDANLEAVALRPYGGAIYHQLFARIMGNFADRPELVRAILAFDAILTERGVVDSDYLWAAYRKPS
jgi:hypothetical protein